MSSRFVRFIRGLGAGESGPTTRGLRHFLIENTAMATGVLIAIVVVALSGDLYLETVATQVLLILVMAYSWNLISGYGGYVSFGQVGFYGAGSYVAALLMIHGGWNCYAAVLGGAALVALGTLPFGFLLLRLNDVYFALATLCLGAVGQLLTLWLPVFGRGDGLVVPSLPTPREAYVAAAVAAALAIGITFCISTSRLGLRAMALRDDEPAMAAVGVQALKTKLPLFGVSAFLASLAGGLGAWNNGFVTPEVAFDPSINLESLLYPLVGGSGTVWGPLFGTVPLELLNSRLGPAHAVLYGIILGVLLMIIVVGAPGGVVGVLNRFGILRRWLIFPRRRTVPVDADTAKQLMQRDYSADLSASDSLELRNVTVNFGGIKALQDVNISIQPGELLLLIGANGAGKTTVVNVLTGYVRPSVGEVHFRGRLLGRMSTSKRARMGLIRTFQIPRLADSLSVSENVMLASLSGSSRADAIERTEWILQSLELQAVRAATTAMLAPGQRRRVELARAIAARPHTILLDEVMAGMGPAEVEEVRRIVRRLREWGIGSMGAIEHVLWAVTDLCDRVIALDFGKVIAEGTADEVLSSRVVQEAYLGSSVENRPAIATVVEEAALDEKAASPAAEPTGDVLVRMDHVSAGYGEITVLNDVSLALRERQFLAILGACGAGKTTLLRAICGVCTVHSGAIEVLGKSARNLPPYRVARAGIAHVPSGRELFAGLSVADNLRLGAGTSSRSDRGDRLDWVLEVFPEIKAFMTKKCGELSGGQQQMVAVGRGLMSAPKALLLDEPSTGLAPIVVGRLLDSLRRLVDTGIGLLLVEQNADQVLPLVDSVCLLREGRISFSGAPADVNRDGMLEAAYFGEREIGAVQ